MQEEMNHRISYLLEKNAELSAGGCWPWSGSGDVLFYLFYAGFVVALVMGFVFIRSKKASVGVLGGRRYASTKAELYSV